MGNKPADPEAARQAKNTKAIFRKVAEEIVGLMDVDVSYKSIKGTDIISVLLKDSEDHDDLLDALDHDYKLFNNQLIDNDELLDNIDIITVDQLVDSLAQAIAAEKLDRAFPLAAKQDGPKTKRKLPVGTKEVEVGGKVIKLPKPKVTAAKRPTIEKVYNAFFKYTARTQQIARSESVRDPAKWQAHMDEAQAEFKAELETLGLAAHIDWTNTGN